MITPRPLALVIMGVSGSGKSTIGKLLADKTGFLFIDADAHHPPSNIEKMKQGIPLNDADRAPWLQSLHLLTRQHLEKGESCILACSALKDSYRRILDHDLEHHFRFIHLDGDLPTIRARMQSRTSHFMPPDLLASQFITLEKPIEASVYSIKKDPEEICNAILNDLEHRSEFGIIGMGVMGSSISRNLGLKNVRLSLYNREVPGSEESLAKQRIKQFPELGLASGFNDLSQFTASLALPRKILLMVPSGDAVSGMLHELQELLSPGDVIIDGGNSNYKETERWTKLLYAKGIYFLGCGISGGEKGALTGPSLMPGGHPEAYLIASPYLRLMAARDRNHEACCSYLGRHGAGHFVKIVHNGIEYGEMQLLAEIYQLVRLTGLPPEKTYQLFADLNTGSLSGYLLSITCEILDHYENGRLLLDSILDKAGNKGTGSWASVAGAEAGTPVNMITESLFARYISFFKEKRTQLHKLYPSKPANISLDHKTIAQAYSLARIINHAQGFELLQSKKEQDDYAYDLHEVARIWTRGCIIRSELMETLAESLKIQPDILFQEETQKAVQEYRPALEAVVIEALRNNQAIPALSAALNYLNGITTADSPAHLIQAQRDYFGAHKYQKRNDSSQNFYHTSWE